MSMIIGYYQLANHIAPFHYQIIVWNTQWTMKHTRNAIIQQTGLTNSLECSIKELWDHISSVSILVVAFIFTEMWVRWKMKWARKLRILLWVYDYQLTLYGRLSSWVLEVTFIYTYPKLLRSYDFCYQMEWENAWERHIIIACTVICAVIFENHRPKVGFPLSRIVNTSALPINVYVSCWFLHFASYEPLWMLSSYLPEMT